MVLTVAAIQMTSQNNKQENLKKADSLLKRGIEAGAVFLSLPENFSFMGKEGEKVRVAEDLENGESIVFLKKFAVKHNVWLLGGSVPLRAGNDKVYNTCLLINDSGEIAGRYDKIHLFDVDLHSVESYKESKIVKGGVDAVCVDTPFCKVGLTICYDLRFPELYRKLTLDGARVIFIPSAFTLQTGRAHWEALIRARAIENQVFVIAPAQFGVHNEIRSTYGNSMIVDPWGNILARADDGEGVITSKIDFAFQNKVRESIPCLKHIFFK